MVENLASVALFSKFCCNTITTNGSHPVNAGTQSNNIGVSLKHSIMERDTRIELVTKPWQGFEIPLHQSRMCLLITASLLLSGSPR